MKLLLDTNALLWWCKKDARLGEKAAQSIKSAAIVYVSVVSAWEMTIKARIGKLEMVENLADTLEKENFYGLSLTFDHIKEFDCLPPTHKDPFDRMIVAQARSENIVLVSSDKMLRKHVAAIVDARN